MAQRRPVAPRTFFLNETHEHARGEPEGGGRVPTFSQIKWPEKGRRLSASLRAARAAALLTADPLRDSRFFLLSSPEEKIDQDSNAKTAKGGLKHVAIDFAGKHARVFERLDLQLLRVTPDGDALVHAKPATLDQLEATAARLATAGKRDQAQWAFLKEFRLAPIETRVDIGWLDTLDPKVAHEVIVEFQPVLTRADVDRLMEAIQQDLRANKGGQALGGGHDLSGRRWLRAQMRSDRIRHFATEFQSIQTIHAPLMATLFATPGARTAPKGSATPPPADVGELPVVAVVDAGVPREHPLLSPYRRGQYRHPDAEQTDPGDHGSRVASRIVFGDLVAGPGFSPPAGGCRFLDVVVPADRNGESLELDGKAIFDSLRDVARAYSDVRVFNLSLGSWLPLAGFSETVRQERLIELQDLDNFAFEHDVVVVVAAGNTPRGVVPNVDYPGHADETDWGLGAWAAGFNTVVVGGYVPRPNADGVARRAGWPSPFTRVGPGIADAPVPSFSAGAGDCSDTYQWKPGLGVWTSNKTGDWEDAIGTSHAAPIVAREAAMLLRDLQKYCPPGVQPFASTAKAFLHLVACHEAPLEELTSAARTLAKRTLGHGRPSAARLGAPSADTAVFLWQGTLESPGHAARVRVPVPREWLKDAGAPQVRVVCAWNTPTGAGAPEVWACRKVNVQLRPSLDGDALRGRGNASGAYPLINKVYDMGVDHLKDHGIKLDFDEWVLELAYVDVAPYPPSMRVDEQQRVSVALELSDESASTESPQAAIQALPVVDTMVRLGGTKQPIWAPIKIPTG